MVEEREPERDAALRAREQVPRPPRGRADRLHERGGQLRGRRPGRRRSARRRERRTGGLPDANHIDNANMATPPDGPRPDADVPVPRRGHGDPSRGRRLDDAGIVYHEYTHGLSNRLVVDSLGNSTLDSRQAGAMGEAWSDWYALDFLSGEGFQHGRAGRRRRARRQLRDPGRDRSASRAIDCRGRARPRRLSRRRRHGRGRVHLRRLRRGPRRPRGARGR